MAASFFNLGARAKKDAKADTAPELQPWVEKYRPAKIADVASQGQVVQVLRRTIESQNLPHLLFYGPPGTGKTSTILALAKELFGPEIYRSRVLELNASDERGIDVVREKIKNFAKSIVAKSTNPEYPTPPYKLIVLDEADSMTPDAQAALRRVMENYSKITRFCLICNYVTRIIEPLASRCAKFRFVSLESHEIKARLASIAEKENVMIDEKALDTIIEVSEGDLRKAIMFLQSGSRVVGPNRPITADVILDISGVVPPSLISRLGELWHAAARPNFAQVSTLVTDVCAEGYSATRVLAQLHAHMLADPQLDSLQKAKLADAFGQADLALTQGADEFLQILNVVLQGCMIAHARPHLEVGLSGGEPMVM